MFLHRVVVCLSISRFSKPVKSHGSFLTAVFERIKKGGRKGIGSVCAREKDKVSKDVVDLSVAEKKEEQDRKKKRGHTER